MLVATFTEVESGRKDARPELARAIAFARRAKATLLVAKLDRLGRRVSFLSKLLEGNVDIAVADVPGMNRLTLHVQAAVAENEAKAISDRTKAALGALKARGVKLGSARPGHWEGREEVRVAAQRKAVAAAAVAHRTHKVEAYADLLPTSQQRRTGGRSLREIAKTLNDAGHSTRTGKAWTAVQVMRLTKGNDAGS